MADFQKRNYISPTHVKLQQLFKNSIIGVYNSKCRKIDPMIYFKKRLDESWTGVEEVAGRSLFKLRGYENTKKHLSIYIYIVKEKCFVASSCTSFVYLRTTGTRDLSIYH
jgi:hypothetical protein